MKRSMFFEVIHMNSISIGIGCLTNIKIDNINIFDAALIAIQLGCLFIIFGSDIVFFDGKYKPNINQI